MQRICDFIKNAGVYFLATIDEDRPRVRPFGTIHIIDGKLCFLTGKCKSVSHQLHDDPTIELSAYKDGQWIRVQAHAIEDPRIEAQEAMLQAYPDLRGMYTPGDGNTEIFKLESGVAVIYSFTAAPVTIRF